MIALQGCRCFRRPWECPRMELCAGQVLGEANAVSLRRAYACCAAFERSEPWRAWRWEEVNNDAARSGSTRKSRLSCTRYEFWLRGLYSQASKDLLAYRPSLPAQLASLHVKFSRVPTHSGNRARDTDPQPCSQRYWPRLAQMQLCRM
jgi:hypothetical protein